MSSLRPIRSLPCRANPNYETNPIRISGRPAKYPRSRDRRYVPAEKQSQFRPEFHPGDRPPPARLENLRNEANLVAPAIPHNANGTLVASPPVTASTGPMKAKLGPR